MVSVYFVLSSLYFVTYFLIQPFLAVFSTGSSTSTGCVCTTQDQRDYIARRGMVAPKVVAPKPKSKNSNQ